jgi:hypothetical protein
MTASAAQPPATLPSASGLLVKTTTEGRGPVFERFFAGYDKAFVLPNEKEDREGFERCFDLNRGADYARLSTLYGPCSEVALIAEEDGLEVGGANFIAMPVDACTVTANLNYIYLNEAARGKGNFSRMFAAVRETIASIFPCERVLVFIEQNDPLRMSEADYRRDTEFTGLDQFDRLRIWAKRGARVVDFPYAQPPLSADQEADDTLVYSVLGAGGGAIEACTLKEHLRRFFGVSVLKGAALADNVAAQGQIDALAGACARGESIALLDPRPLLAKLHRREDIARTWSHPPRDFRTALRNTPA